MWSTTLFLIGLLSVLAAQHPYGAAAETYGSLMDLIIAHPDLSNLETWVNATGLDVVLSNSSLSATAFLPTNMAISTFVTNVMGLPDVGSVNTSIPATKTALTRLLNYHLVEGAQTIEAIFFLTSIFNNNSGNHSLPTFLSKSIPSTAVLVQYGKLRLNIATSTLGDTYGGQEVQLNRAANISAGNNTAYLIDNVLVFWYRNMWQALKENNLTAFQTALTAASAVSGNYNWPTIFANASSTYTVFGLTQSAFDYALSKYSLNLKDGSAASADILNYHISKDVSRVDPYNSVGDVTYTTLSKATGAPLTMSSNVGRVVTLYGFNALSTGVVGAQLPVGGLVPVAYLNLLDYALFPVFTDVVSALKGAGDPYKQFANLLTVTSLYVTLSNPNASVTVLPPNEAGWKAYQDKYGISNIAAYYQTNLNALLSTHVLTVPRNATAIQVPQYYNTYVPGQLVTTSIGSASTTLTFDTGLTNAKIAGLYNISVLYGRSYIYSINYVLVPTNLGLPPLPGGAATASPSSLLTLLLLGCALLVAKAGNMA